MIDVTKLLTDIPVSFVYLREAEIGYGESRRLWSIYIDRNGMMFYALRQNYLDFLEEHILTSRYDGTIVTAYSYSKLITEMTFS